jgi:hypothetical protein
MLRDFKRPDLKAPRFRPRTLHIFNKDFCSKVRVENKAIAHLTDEQIEKIIVTGNAIIQQMVMDLRDGVELPEQLGLLFIGSTPATRERNIDYKRSAELGKTVHYKNWETDGLTCNLFYNNYESKYKFKYHELWTFSPVREFMRASSKVYRNNHTRYVRVDNWMKIGILFRKHKAKEEIRKKVEDQLEDYDEFDLN